MVTEPDQPFPVAGRTQTGFGIVTPLLPQGRSCCGFIVGERHRLTQLLQARRQSTRSKGILEGVCPFPTAAHNGHGFR